MRHIILFAAVSALAGSTFCATAAAQEANTYLGEHLRAPKNTLELKIGTGYTQGFGNIAPGRSLPDVAGAGIGAQLDLDYRINHHWSIGVEGQYQEFTSEQNSSSRGMAANLGATYHLSPILRGDPWIRIGTGYRLLWEQEPNGAVGVSQLRHGFELGAAKVGYDVRVSEDVAIAPVIGADLNVFLWENPSAASNGALTSGQVATFIYAGMQGRFDFGGVKREEPLSTARLTSVPAPTPPPPTTTLQEPVAVTPSLRVSQDILDRCKMDLNSIDNAPKFDFDKSDLLPQDYAVLQMIAQCFTTGPMKGLGVQLVGRADPRGTVEYNMALGGRRANSAATYLESLGMGGGQIGETSRGNLDATGHDEATWAIDRRVDIVLR